MTIAERFAYATSYFRWKDGSTISMMLNVFIFMPFGILVPLLRGKTAPITTTVLAIFSTLTIESLQLILAIGYFTYSDLILNTLGAVLGIIIYSVFVKRMKEEQKKKALIFLNGLAIVVSIFAIINTVLNIEIYM
jgi:glycopeptide antibiotics resistance protein